MDTARSIPKTACTEMAGSDRQTSTDNGLPCRFGKYELLRKIGAGGMAEVFKAKLTGEHGFEKLVAIKRILPHLSHDPDFLSMFMEEARLAALLSHQNIVQIYDFGNVDGTYFICMEYLRGNNLRTLLQKAGAGRPLPLPCSLTIASRICAGIEYAHNLKDMSGTPLGIIHCDINPQNILITHLGETKILDFGIARIAAGETAGQNGILQGKVRYMSPEQACCRAVDRRSDIYSIGVLLYEMVTGEQAFRGEIREAFKRVRRGEFPPPEQLAPGLPDDICDILHTAMAKEPDERFQSCAAMYARLDRCLMSRFGRQSAEDVARHLRRHLRRDAAQEPRPQKRHETLMSFLNRVRTGRAESTPTRKIEEADPQPRRGVSRGEKGRARGGWAFAAVALLSLALFALVLLSPGRSIQQPQDDRVEEALSAVEAGAYGRALLLFERLLTQDPELLGELAAPYARALLQEGMRLARSDQRLGSRLIWRSIELDPANAQAHFELGKLQTKLHEVPAAIESYRKALELDSSSPKTFFNLGFLYAKTADYERAEEMYRRAVDLAPPYLDEAYFNLAMVQRSQGKTQESIRSLKQAVAANPANRLAAEYLERFTRGS
jgi:serine/threonine protein kinase/Flp pilus assembly protein TadD